MTCLCQIAVVIAIVDNSCQDKSGQTDRKTDQAKQQTSPSLGSAVSGAKMSLQQSFCISLTVITENRTSVSFVFLSLSLFSLSPSIPLSLTPRVIDMI